MSKLLSTKEVAAFLNVNEKMVYTLIADKALPATKITGKWLFPQHLVEQWVENNTTNYPKQQVYLPAEKGVVIVAGSNDILLDRVISAFNTSFSGCLGVFANVGSMGGITALRQNLCHVAASHLIQDDESDYNFQFVFEELKSVPVVVNFCRRRQGLLFKKNNPLNITGLSDLGQPGIRMVNRSLGTGTRLLLDNELKKHGLEGQKITGYDVEVDRHMDIGLEILSGRADVGPGIEAIAGVLDLGFLPLRWERFDLLISKNQFFEKNIQRFLGILEQDMFSEIAAGVKGYDTEMSGKMVYQAQE